MRQCYTYTGSDPGPHVLILAGVHGDEYEPIAAVRELSMLLGSRLLAGRVTLVPVVNPPAFERLARTGPDGLDLARTFPGHPAGTVTEQIAAEVAEWIRSADFLIDLHTGGQALTITPLVGYMLHEDRAVLEAQRRMAHAFNLPIIWGTSPRLEGRTLSVARDAGVPAIYAEWGGGGGCQAEGVADYVQGCLNVLAQLSLLQAELPSSRVRHLVEDRREQSGHLQLNYPAPVTGFYQTVAKVGELLKTGDLLGILWPLEQVGNPAVPPVKIRAEQTGLLLLTRVIPAVQAGDCLATILELETQAEFQEEESTPVDSEREGILEVEGTRG